MIIDSNYIREIRDISINVDDVKRIDPYIEEAEKEWVIPSIGAKLYKDLDSGVGSDNNTLLLEGGYYNNDTAYLSGLKKAISYLAYSRYVRNSNVFLTSSGARTKGTLEFSDSVDDRAVVRVANEAEKRGIKLLDECVAYLNYIGSQATRVKSKKKFIIIGD
ncbi:MAG: hypothetical protein RBT05_03720 [Bacteroidales bacterium]|jgi:hypothetical protein|nr:hypothetical protein [Bacteroidales bacterium]